MKKFFLILVIYSTGIFCQEIPNGDFENWTDGNPVGWYTSNFGNIILPVTKTPACHSGSYALKGEIISVIKNPVQPLLVSGLNADGFSISDKPDTLAFYLQFFPLKGDKFNIAIELSRENMSIGSGSLEISSTIPSYTRIAVPIDYINTKVPDRCVITFGAGINTTPHAGTFFLIDDFQFNKLNAINETITANSYELQQNYPNPLNPSTTIKYLLPFASKVRIEVYDFLGNEIEMLVNEEQPAGTHEIIWNAVNLPSGVYFYKLTAGSFTMTKKMILMK